EHQNGRARGGDPRLGGRVRGRDRGQRGAAVHHGRPRRRPGGPAVGGQLLPPHARRAHPHLGIARGPLRRAAALRPRGGGLRPDERPVRPRAVHRGARRRAGPAGRLRRDAHPRVPGDHHRRLPARRAGEGDRHVDGVGRDRDPHRPAARRADRRLALLALGLRHQRAARGADARARLPLRPRGPPDRGPAAPRRRARCGPLRARPRRPDVRAHRAAHARLGRSAGLGHRHRRPRPLRRLPAPRGPRARADAPARALRPAQLPLGEHRDARHVRRAVDHDVLPRALPPAGGGLQRAAGGDDHARPDGGHVRPVPALRRAGRPVRPAAVHGVRADRLGLRAAPPRHAGGRDRVVRGRPAAGTPPLLDRAVDRGGAAHRGGAGRRGRGPGRHRVRREQRGGPDGGARGHGRGRRGARRLLRRGGGRPGRRPHAVARRAGGPRGDEGPHPRRGLGRRHPAGAHAGHERRGGGHLRARAHDRRGAHGRGRRPRPGRHPQPAAGGLRGGLRRRAVRRPARRGRALARPGARVARGRARAGL
ncbi:MAG: Uncharacterized MFS-type transporter, partial [uncultured Solirubrobacteraceae bacterium]